MKKLFTLLVLLALTFSSCSVENTIINPEQTACDIERSDFQDEILGCNCVFIMENGEVGISDDEVMADIVFSYDFSSDCLGTLNEELNLIKNQI